jgi:hypothetical protein
MINLDEQKVAQETTLLWEEFIKHMLGIHEAKTALQHYVADYIESIELPKIRRPMYRPNRQLPPYLAGAETLDPEHVKMMKCYNSGYNLATKDCQAKLDEAVKELRK